MNPVQNKKTRFIDIGLKDYQQAWDYQASLFEQILATKTANRDLPADAQQRTDNYLVFCEHPHVFTLGKSGHEENLIIPKEELSDVQATYYRVNRGGDITYHGPGQIVGYPIIDMENFFTDIHRYMRFMEEAVIQTLREYNVEAGRSPGQTGVWLDPEDFVRARKICALGVRTSRWVTMHGFAFNVNPDLRYFGYIVPCGIQDKAVTSLEQELGKKVDLEEVKQILKEKIRAQFDMEWL
ncbi:lipoyl(octanoyl) transferase LipB [Parachryseolinea silvisoli]|uniref:lipoyl(octanoyl) transferase LipB n=1 Tax=Parachryseolinea silvisoli TaxID=2873601 RepID=UPI002265CCB3|nr:lipoyl(octanoyl) transferase LipB [Parachryseolinea silvisoli]MCD9016437.1 lipoyl(octanoyl) transferase LipB [Parachryseolinea silvisoli]